MKIVRSIILIAAMLAGSLPAAAVHEESVALPIGQELVVDLGDSNLVLSRVEYTEVPSPTPTSTVVPTVTLVPTATKTNTPLPKVSPTASPTNPSPTASPTSTVPVQSPSPTVEVTPTEPPTGNFQPRPNAPICADHGAEHDISDDHGIWDYQRDCHYDHEHGESPFTPEVADAFPGFDFNALLCGMRVSHCNPSSPTENVHKHGGNKWQVDLANPNGPLPICQQGFEDGTIAVKAYAIQFHAFGRQDIEHEVRNHSSVAFLVLCRNGNPNDVGYVFVSQLQEYGQRVMPYQGYVMPYPDNFQPQYISPRGPYFTTECFGNDFSFVDLDGATRLVDCRDPGDTLNNNNTIWTSKPTRSGGPSERPQTPIPFRMLFRGRDNYQRVDVNDLVHPFTWMFVCGGASYNPVGCRFNSSTMTVQEVMGDIPVGWDNLAGFDVNPAVGRITTDGVKYVNRFGTQINFSCTVAGGLDCQPIQLINAFVGRYSSELSVDKVSNPTPGNTPERDIYFCRGVPCSEGDMGAVPSGWIGSEN